jgi:hypothetical protein
MPMTRTTGPLVDLDQLARSQRGLLTRTQVLECGHTDADIRQELRQRRWQRVLPGLYGSFTGEPTLEQRRLAASLYAGPRSQMTGVAALRWQGLRQLPGEERIHMLVPHDSRRTSAGFVLVHRTKDLDERARRANGYAICSVARAVADACRRLEDLAAVRAIVAESVQRGLTSTTALQTELERAGRHRTRLLRMAVSEAVGGAASGAEAAVQALLEGSRILGPILWNPVLETLDGTRLPTPDGWIPEAALALEIDSREYHLDPEGWERTLRRHNTLAEVGAMVLHFTPTEARRPRRILRITERAYLARIRSGATAQIRVVHDGRRG